MLTVVRSPLPHLPRDPAALPVELADWAACVRREPGRCLWVVPTERRRRDLLRNLTERSDQPASLLPGLHTVASLVARALACSSRQRPWVGGPERLLRIARAWQEAVGRPPGSGLVRQLDRFVRHWQAAGLAVPDEPVDLFEKVVHRYLKDLESDWLLDRQWAVEVLTAEVFDRASWPNRLLFDGCRGILFDGFHRFEAVELNLIAALAGRRDVWVWLVGASGQASWRTLEAATRHLQERAREVAVIDFLPEPAGLSALGRNLFPAFPSGAGNIPPQGNQPAVYKLEASDPAAEVEAVAKRIKVDYLDAAANGNPVRLSDVAVVLPGPEYAALISELFPRLGLPFHFVGGSLPVIRSRPARVLFAAWQLSRGQWRHDLLLDFLSQPLVRDRLKEAHRLHDLFRRRPRARRALDYASWAETWHSQIRKLEDDLARWRAGDKLPDWNRKPRDEFLSVQEKVAAGLRQLVASVEAVLTPVVVMDRLLTAPAGEAPIRALVRACLDLLRTLRIDAWLTPPAGETDPSVPWDEYAQDRQAYARLLAALDALGQMRDDRLPFTRDRKPDGFTALHLALDGETFEPRTEDDAGVQVLEASELPGLHFRQVYILGLVDGRVPPPPEEGLFARRLRRQPALAEQLRQQENEHGFLFSQVFESAAESVVLSRPLREGDEGVLPSPFLAAVARRVELRPAEPPAVVASLREAGCRPGRSAVGGKRTWGGPVTIEAPALLRLLFPPSEPFSLSQLETYAACPFRYFGGHVLRLEERDSDETRIHYGKLIHRILQNLYEGLWQTPVEERAGPLADVLADHPDRLLRLFESEWRQLDDGTLPPDLKTLFAWEGGVLHLLTEAIGFIEADHGNYLNEHELSDGQDNSVPLGADGQGIEVRLSGTVDCVALRRNNPRHAIILDYKTGRAGPRSELAAKMADGRLLQLPLYGAALETMYAGLRVVGGAYVHLSEKEGDARKAVLAAGELLPGRGEPLPFDLAAARDKAIELAGEIRAGRFPLSVHDAARPHGECNFFCAFRHACRHPKGYRTPYGS